MRPLVQIAADLHAAQLRVQDLRAELVEAETARNRAIFELFDSGVNQAEVARQLRLPKSIVAGLVHRSGRSARGRDAVRHQIRAATQAQVSA